MANDYLAMYISIAFDLGEIGNIVAIRHFSATTARLSAAIQSKSFFTDLNDVKNEAQLVAQARQVTILLDSTLPGRKNIIPRAASTNLSRIYSKFNNLLNPAQPKPTVTGPYIADFNIRSGMRNLSLPRPYKDEIVDSQHFKGGVFDMGINGGARFRVIPPVILDNNIFLGVTFHGWSRMLLTNF